MDISEEQVSKDHAKRIKPISRHSFFFFRFLDEFAKSKDIKNNANVYTEDDPLQSIDTDYYGPFQLYFNLFEPLEGSVAASASKNSRHNQRILDAFILQNDTLFAEEDK